MPCHFGLAQPFIIPLILYLLLLFEKKPSFLISFFIGLTVFLTSLLHFYFFGINVFIISFYFFFRLFTQSKTAEQTAILPTSWFKNVLSSPPAQYAIRMIPHYFLMTCTTLLFYYFWMMSKDPVLDRSPEPYGFLVYLANWEGVFTWQGNPFWGWINDQIFILDDTGFEGQVYIGLVATLFFVGCIFAGIRSLWKRSLFTFFTSQSSFFKASLGSGLVLLMLSMGLPFIIPPFEFLMDYVGPLRQFRSMGRFAWAFYFVINIWAFHSVYFYLKNRSIKWQYGGFVLILGLLLWESFQFNQQFKFQLQKVPYWTTGIPFTAIDSIDFERYQATVPIPYFSIGSNNFNKGPEGFNLQRSGIIGTQTGLPTTGAMLTRSSLKQTFNQWQLVLEPYRTPAIFKDFVNEKPLLLVWFNNPKEDYMPRYGHLLNHAKSIYKEGQLELYHTELSDFSERIKEKQVAIKNVIQQDSLFKINGFASTDSAVNFVYQDFETMPSIKAYLSKGAFSGQLNQSNPLFFDVLPNVEVDSLYHLQMWTWVQEDKLAETVVLLEEEDLAGNILQRKEFRIWPDTRTFDPNGWALMECFFQPKAVDSRFKFSFQGAPRDERIQYFDELLIKPVGTHLYKELDNYWWMDNLWMEK